MRWGETYLYVEANDNEVIFHSETVKVLGENDVSRESIPYTEITAVGFRNSGGITPCYTLSVNYRGSAKPRSIGFYRLPGVSANRLRAEGEAIKRYIEAKVRKTKEIQKEIRSNNTRESSIDELFKLKTLLDNGLITMAEFNKLKARMISDESENYNSSNVYEGENRKKKCIYNKLMLGVNEFIVDTGKERWNFITDYATGEISWYEFCETDITFKTARGINIKSTYEEIYNKFIDVTRYIDDQYDYRKDKLYIWSHREGKDGETKVLKECKKVIKLINTLNPKYEYSLSFYFDKNKKLKLIGYVKNKI